MSGLAHDLETLRRRARWFVLVRGVATVVAMSVGLGLVLGSLDCFFRWPHLSGRWVQSTIWLAATFIVAWKFLIRPLRTHLTSLELAQAIHRRWPSQTPDLTSAVEFESARFDHHVGAPLLQQVTLSRARLQLATVPWKSVVDPQRVYGAIAIAMTAVGIFLLAATLALETTSVGALRLFSPWLDLDWPRRTTLVYLNSELVPIDTSRDPAVRTGQGEPLTLYVKNRSGSLPSKVLYERKTLTGERELGELRQTTLNDSQGRPHRVAVAHWHASTSFEFRARGGDDERAPWMTINVVPPPRVQTFEMTLTPPKYSGRPSESFSSGVGHLQGLVGSRVQIRCRAVAPLQSAALCKGNEPRQQLLLSPDGIEFSLDWTISAAERSTYWLDLVDALGLRVSNPPRYEIRGVADQEPVVSLLSPVSDLRVTPQAEISISGEARDDLGLQRTELVYELPSASPDVEAANSPLAITQHIIPLGPTQPGQPEQAIQTLWKLTDLKLPAGTQVRYWLQATDACDLHGMPGQIGRSAVRVLSILTPEEKLQELSGQQIQLAERINQLRLKQSAIEQTTREIIDQWQSVGTLRPNELQELENLQTKQKEIAQELGQDSQSVLSDLRKLQLEHSANQLNTPQTDELLSRWNSTLVPLTEDVLPAVISRLETSRHGVVQAQSDQPRQKEQTTAALDQAHAGQLRTLDDLSNLSSEIAQWRRGKDLDKSLIEIASRQAELRELSLTIGRQTSTKTMTELSPQEQADLSRAADRQISLARDVEHLTSQLEAGSTDDTLPIPDGSISSTAKQLAELAISATMRDASEALRQNHIQSATDTQLKLIDALDQLKLGIEQQRAHSAKNEVETLRKSVKQVRDLAQRQADLRRRTEAMSTPSADSQRAIDSAESQQLQQELADQTMDLAQRLRLDQRSAPSSSAKRAGERMREARENLEQKQLPQTVQRQSEALDELQNTKETLEKSLQEASQRADLERMSSVEQLVVALRARAQTTHDDTVRLEQLRTTQGKWTRSQLKSVQQTADVQQDIAKNCEEANEQLASTGILRLCLELATEHFRNAATQLEERHAGNVPQSEQLAAIQLLDQLIASLSASLQPSASADGEKAAPPPLNRNQPPTSSPLLTAEIQLLLKMQEELLARTRVLADLKASGQSLTTEQLSEQQQLRDRQKRLTQTARTMMASQNSTNDSLIPTEGSKP